MPITSSKSDQIFQMVSRKESTPWTNRSVVLEKNYTEKIENIYKLLLRFGLGSIAIIKPLNFAHLWRHRRRVSEGCDLVSKWRKSNRPHNEEVQAKTDVKCIEMSNSWWFSWENVSFQVYTQAGPAAPICISAPMLHMLTANDRRLATTTRLYKEKVTKVLTDPRRYII